MKKLNHRILSIDILRGAVLLFMILVNTPGVWDVKSIYSPLLHAKWHGITPTDLVFPLFLFIMGCSMWYSFKTYNYQLTKNAIQKIIKRTALIFGIGVLLNMFPLYTTSFFKNSILNGFEWRMLVEWDNLKLGTLRIPGVLQRIALVYGITSFLFLGINKKKQLFGLSVLILFLYGILLYFLPHKGEPFGKETIINTIDIFLFGSLHIYHNFGLPFDPEGIFNAIPAVVTALIGVWASSIIDKKKVSLGILKKLLIYGMILILSGGISHIIFPINKPLWSSSYVLYTGGVGMWLLATFYYLADYHSNKKILLLISVLNIIIGMIGSIYIPASSILWTLFCTLVFIGFAGLLCSCVWKLPNGIYQVLLPLKVFGYNPLFIFVMSGVIVKLFSVLFIYIDGHLTSLWSARWTYFYAHLTSVPQLNSLVSSLSFIIFLWLLAYWLYRKKIIIKI